MGFPGGSVVKNRPANAGDIPGLGRFPGEEYPNILAWEIPQTGESGRLQSMELQRVGHNLATKQQQFTDLQGSTKAMSFYAFLLHILQSLHLQTQLSLPSLLLNFHSHSRTHSLNNSLPSSGDHSISMLHYNTHHNTGNYSSAYQLAN